MSRERQLRRIRLLVAFVIAGLVASGLSAFPLLREAVLLDRFAHDLRLPISFSAWTAHIHEGLEHTYYAYPFIAYGTDWLAFGHFIIALFMIGAYIDPMRNVWLIRAGMIACALVIPTALFCGAVRDIPLWWRAIDSAFGLFGFIPLWLAARLVTRLSSQ
jgi:hypothetical protein